MIKERKKGEKVVVVVITFSLDVSSTAAVDIFWRFGLTMFTSSESAADWIFTRTGPTMCSITAA